MGVPPLSDPLTAVGVEAPAITSLTSPGAGARPFLTCPADGPHGNQCPRQPEDRSI
ncbi:hypothetical protein WN51_04278 [Melipona quadrifasciata]|uniref:Uncharacterized protein n=2 Tax=Melipona TaxID=28651 RepID=A0A0N0BCN0_9HYME|nr:hypothetical protein K0M31_009429 [Melipona bicolor]KOX69242.1 hypothetical protein WN51_04278 [Melipona quadrifasciata]